jgi:hypothetical protein
MADQPTSQRLPQSGQKKVNEQTDELCYHNTVEITLSYGYYKWCGNNYDESISGYYLTKNITGQKGQIMVTLDLTIDAQLVDKVQKIEMYYNDGGLAQYTVEKIQRKHKFFFPIDEKYTMTSLCIKYQTLYTGRFNLFGIGRPPVRTIHTDFVAIPEIDINKPQECIICFEMITDDKYITTCHHMFHASCIWKYLEYNHMVITKSLKCHRFHCVHGDKVKSFYCPICRMRLEKLVFNQ